MDRKARVSAEYMCAVNIAIGLLNLAANVLAVLLDALNHLIIWTSGLPDLNGGLEGKVL